MGGGTGYNGGENGGKCKMYENQVCNPNMHPILAAGMNPILDKNMPFKLNTLCNLVGLNNMRDLTKSQKILKVDHVGV